MSPQCITVGAPASACADVYDLFMRGNSTLLMDNMYATIPMIAIEAQSACSYALFRPVRPDTTEEELHTSFEQAISDRVTALNSRLQRITRSTGPAPALAPFSSCSLRAQGHTKTASHPRSRLLDWQRPLLLGSLALMFLLLGFDLMGLLVLSLH